MTVVEQLDRVIDCLRDGWCKSTFQKPVFHCFGGIVSVKMQHCLVSAIRCNVPVDRRRAIYDAIAYGLPADLSSSCNRLMHFNDSQDVGENDVVGLVQLARDRAALKAEQLAFDGL